MLDTEIANLVDRTKTILGAALRMGHIPLNDGAFLNSPIAASVFELLVKQDELKVYFEPLDEKAEK